MKLDEKYCAQKKRPVLLRLVKTNIKVDIIRKSKMLIERQI